MRDIGTSTGRIIPFPEPSDRRIREPLAADEPRGAILLFTGVRYERLSEPNPEPSPALSHGRARRRRRS